MGYWSDSESDRCRDNVGVKHVVGLVAFAVLLFTPLLFLFHGINQRERQEENVKHNSQNVVVFKQECSKDKGDKKMAVKILAGHSGQADENLPPMGCSYDYTAGWFWELIGPGDIVAWSFDPQGWSVAPGGMVTVPLRTPPGNYSFLTVDEEPCDLDPPDTGGYVRSFRFEVICNNIIPRGTSGQACFYSSTQCADGANGEWHIYREGTGEVASMDEHNGWTTSPTGTIGVPVGAIPGNYHMTYGEEVPECDVNENLVRMTTWNFTVPCVDIELTATLISGSGS